ncbi:MAG: Rrf2 family transcriptional regulator [Chloroflexota bacterium]
MNTNLRFAISIHALALLALSKDPLTSEAIAGSVNTNPVVVRRTMANLREHGLVESRPGTNGGWRLLRAPGQIRLCEVYRSLEQEEVLAVHANPDIHCPIGGHIKETLHTVFTTAQTQLESALDQYTIADVLNDVLARGK